jgi:hypothetical protein
MYAYVSLLGGNMYTTKKNRLVSDARKVIGFEVNAEATRYTNMFMSRH